MNVWFMYDNHTFAMIGDDSTSREAMEIKARECFGRDGSGTLFAIDSQGQPVADCQDEFDMPEFFDLIEEHMNWEARG